MTLGYLGPEGTFSEQAAVSAGDFDRIPLGSIPDVLKNVQNEKLDFGIVPIENVIEGTVNATFDTLVFDTDLYVHSKIIIPINQCLIAKSTTALKDIKKIISHNHAIPQCRKFLSEFLPNVQEITASSTAEAAKIVSQSEEKIAAVASEYCAQLYNLSVLEKSIQDNKGNYTEFILVSKEKTEISSDNKRTILAFSTQNKPGALYKILGIISMLDINMIKIGSRPMRDKKAEYVFYIETDGKNDTCDLISAIKIIERKTTFLKFLGSYNVKSFVD